MRQLLRRFPEPVAAKVPVILAVFWVVKVLTTAFGEAFSDFLGKVSISGGAVLELSLVASALWLQFRSTRYRPLTYWYLAGSIAVFGTAVADVTHKVGLSYSVTSAGWATALAVVFWRWHATEGTLSIHSIVTRRREAYYWATVFCTFALGTALGDWSATVLGLGYLTSALLYTALIVVPLAAWKLAALDPVAAFWSAYVLTRPLGASYADYFGRSKHLSGAGLGSGKVSIVLFAAVAAGVAYLERSGVDRQPEELAEPLV